MALNTFFHLEMLSKMVVELVDDSTGGTGEIEPFFVPISKASFSGGILDFNEFVARQQRGASFPDFGPGVHGPDEAGEGGEAGDFFENEFF